MTVDREAKRSNRRELVIPVCALLVAIFFAAPVMSQKLGRFFSTPEERRFLNELRADRDLVKPDPEPVEQTATPEPVVEQLSIEGLVIRSGGVNSAWVNGRLVSDGWTTIEGVRADAVRDHGSGRIKITLPNGVDTIDLKPGQKIDVESGMITEEYDEKRPLTGSGAFGSTAIDDQANPGAVETGNHGG